MSKAIEADYDERTVFDLAKDYILAPVALLTSKPAQRAYVQSILLALAAFALALISIVAYAFFYYSFIPRTAFARPIHLQFGPSHHPWGIADLGSELVSAQRYDVAVVLHMPRSPANLAEGNFMIDLTLSGPNTTTAPGAVVARSRRPAVMTYYSRGVDRVNRAVELPLYLTGLKYEAETLVVPMMEGVVFERGWRNIPASVKVEVVAKGELMVYSARVEFGARFRGLRWLMYRHRIISFLMFTSAFWVVEMGTAILLWLAISFYTAEPAPAPIDHVKTSTSGIKGEDEDASEYLSDASRTFPTYQGQPALHYSSPHVKEEEDADAPGLPTLSADDEEDEDADFVLDPTGLPDSHRSDSGLGTSMDSGVERLDAVRRRKAGGGDGRALR